MAGILAGRFVFNIGTEFLGEEEPDPRWTEMIAAMRAIATRDYGWTPAPASRPPRQPLTRESVGQSISAAGLELDRVELLEYIEHPDAMRAWLSIPVFTRQYLPGLPYQDRMAILDRIFPDTGELSPVPPRLTWPDGMPGASGARFLYR